MVIYNVNVISYNRLSPQCKKPPKNQSEIIMSAPAVGFPSPPHPKETRRCSSDQQNKPMGEVHSRFSLLYSQHSGCNEGGVTESQSHRVKLNR